MLEKPRITMTKKESLNTLTAISMNIWSKIVRN